MEPVNPKIMLIVLRTYFCNLEFLTTDEDILKYAEIAGVPNLAKIIFDSISLNKKLIGKSSGSATGVGVKVYSTANNSEVQLNADNSNEIIFNYANWSNNLLYFPFTAQLVKDGSNGISCRSDDISK